MLPIKSAVQSSETELWYLVVRLLIDTRYVSSIYGLLQHFLNEAQDETQAVITQQAVRKKKPTHTSVLKIICAEKSSSPLSIF